MKICAISDLHHPHNQALVEHYKPQMKASDVIVIAGDISSDETKYAEVLKSFREFKGLKITVLGNHDLYTEPYEDSFDKIRRLEEICTENGFHLLDTTPVVGDVSFVGNIGWYDYQFAYTNIQTPVAILKSGEAKTKLLTEFTDEDFAAKNYLISNGRLRRHIWEDINHIHWNFSDKEFLALQAENLRKQLQKVSQAKQIVYVSHHIPIPEFIYSRNEDPVWSLFNAYQGSPELGKIAFSDPRLRLVICGHSHIPNNTKIGNVDCHDVSHELGMLRPRFIEI